MVRVFIVTARDGVLSWMVQERLFVEGLLAIVGVLNAVFSVLRRVLGVCSFVPPACETLVAVRVECPSSRVQRVYDALHGNAPACKSHSHKSPACSLHVLHDARCGVNS